MPQLNLRLQMSVVISKKGVIKKATLCKDDYIKVHNQVKKEFLV